MNLKAQRNSKYDFLFWSIITLVIAGGIAANYYFYYQPLAIRLIGWLVLICALVPIAWQTRSGQRLWIFMREARTELRKVVWPTRPETIQTTFIIIVLVVVLACVLWGVDSLLLWAVALLTGQRG
jgi:preprotein translocase subunit SecE